MFLRSVFVVIFFLNAVSSAMAEEKLQAMSELYEFAKESIARNIPSSAEYQVEVLPVDSQLRLTSCNVPLVAFKLDATIKAGRTIVGVRCNGQKKWSLYLSAVVKVFETVIVLTRPVQRGEKLSREHLTLEKKEVSGVQGDYATSFEQVENKEVIRNFPAGAILGLRSIIQPPLVKRKDPVIIRSDLDGVSVQMTGTALSDGAEGQTIRVKNESSGRVVTATVIEAGVVSVK